MLDFYYKYMGGYCLDEGSKKGKSLDLFGCYMGHMALYLPDAELLIGECFMEKRTTISRIGVEKY